MARTTDPRGADFDAAAFRDAIHFAMRMGAPEAVNERLTFRWTPRDTFTVADPAGRTYDWTQAPTATTTITDIQLDCAWKFAGGPTAENPMGQFDQTKIEVTLLDEEYQALLAHSGGDMPDLIVAGGNDYVLAYMPPPNGLFDVTVYTLYAEARDES